MLIKTVIITFMATVLSASPYILKQTQAAEDTKDSATTFTNISNDVKNIQKKLLKAGFLSVRVDGIFGPETSLAITQYQKKYSLPQSSFPDKKFLAHLNENFGSK